MEHCNPKRIAGSIYANYIIQSISLTVLMQFSLALSPQFYDSIVHNYPTIVANNGYQAALLVGIGYIASGIGIGKILLMLIGGLLSDRYGRKPFIFMGMFSYILFYVGIMLTNNIHVAFVLAMFIGIGNSFLDTGSMPALTECFPRAAGTASVLIKAFISLGTLILPLIVALIDNQHISYKWAFAGFILFLLGNMLYIAKQTFPSKETLIAAVVAEQQAATNGSYFIGRPKMLIEGSCLILLGFTTTATFVVIMQWLPAIAQSAVGMSPEQANALLSYYSTGSIISVFCTAYFVKKFLQPIYCIIVLPLLSGIILFLFWLNITPLMCVITAFLMGFTAAGGVLQLALVVMQQLFPYRKGLAVGLMYTLSGCSFIVIPLVVPRLAVIDVSYAILLDMVIAFSSVILALIVYKRFQKVVDMGKI